MWLEKLFSGVLRVSTPLGPRYLNPSFSQRIYLIWIFRHFERLPVKVLSSRQRRMIESMYVNHQFIPLATRSAGVPILGTLDGNSRRAAANGRYSAAPARREPGRVAPLARDMERRLPRFIGRSVAKVAAVLKARTLQPSRPKAGPVLH